MIIAVFLWIFAAGAFLLGWAMLLAGNFTLAGAGAALPAFVSGFVLFGLGQLAHALERTAIASEKTNRLLESIETSLRMAEARARSSKSGG